MDKEITREALKSLRKELRDRTGKNKIFKLVEVKSEQPKEEEEKDEEVE
jgi:hypothetical protein